MKKLIEIVDGEGFEYLIGQRVTLFCWSYIYTGKLVGVNDKFVKLEDGGIVYSTGDFKDKDWADYQKMPNDIYVTIQSIESYSILK